MRFGPVCAKVGFFDTSCECFRAGSIVSNLLIYQEETQARLICR
jgi:hypothetical protein